MTYYLYIQPDGLPDVTTHPLDLALFPGHRLLSSSEVEPDVRGKRYVDGRWVRASGEPQYVEQRRVNYPAVGDQLDALWHAMNKGLIPVVEPFYSDIKRVKERYPRSNE